MDDADNDNTNGALPNDSYSKQNYMIHPKFKNVTGMILHLFKAGGDDPAINSFDICHM